MKIGIVGHGTDKFTPATRRAAVAIIRMLLKPGDVLVSGHSPVGGIDIWAEEVARDEGIAMDLKIPRQNKWDAEYGFKQRNLDIARDSDEVHVIVVENYPMDYHGRRWLDDDALPVCYHCARLPEVQQPELHVKSGGCWTGIQARRLGKPVTWHILPQ